MANAGVLYVVEFGDPIGVWICIPWIQLLDAVMAQTQPLDSAAPSGYHPRNPHNCGE